MARRMSVTIETETEATVKRISEESPERKALLDLLPDVALSSDGAILRALIAVGTTTVQEQLLDDGYASLAADYREDDPDRVALKRGRVRRDSLA